MIEFLVDTIRREINLTYVTGVVNAGIIRLGSAFNWVSGSPASAAERLETGGDIQVLLSVEGIVAYRRELDELHEGMTGQLRLSGEGAETISHGVFLRGMRA
jgi:hypothetical protein